MWLETLIDKADAVLQRIKINLACMSTCLYVYRQFIVFKLKNKKVEMRSKA